MDNNTKLCYTRIEKVKVLLEELVQRSFYGEVLIKFEAGQITVCRKTESIKM